MVSEIITWRGLFNFLISIDFNKESKYSTLEEFPHPFQYSLWLIGSISWCSRRNTNITNLRWFPKVIFMKRLRNMYMFEIKKKTIFFNNTLIVMAWNSALYNAKDQALKLLITVFCFFADEWKLFNWINTIFSACYCCFITHFPLSLFFALIVAIIVSHF